MTNGRTTFDRDRYITNSYRTTTVTFPGDTDERRVRSNDDPEQSRP
jgi:hypothetical protein